MVKPTLSVFTGSKSLGTVLREEIQLIPNLSEYSLPATDSGGNIAIKFKGVRRVIILQGIQNGNGFSGVTSEQKIADFVSEVEDWINTNLGQDSFVYANSLNQSYDVKCFDFTWSRGIDDPNRIIYTFLLHEV